MVGTIYGHGHAVWALSAEDFEVIHEAHQAFSAVLEGLGVTWGDLATVERKRIVVLMRSEAVRQRKRADEMDPCLHQREAQAMARVCDDMAGCIEGGE